MQKGTALLSSRLGRIEEIYRYRVPQVYKNSDIPNGDLLHDSIPTTFAEFFADFQKHGPLEHDYDRDAKTGLPTTIQELAPYQLRFANLDYGFMLKTNKAGMTTSEMLCDFWTRLLPKYAGFDCVIAGSKIEIVNDFLLRLKTLVANNSKYSKYLITRPERGRFREQKSKMGAMVIRNPYDPGKVSRIITIGNSSSSAYSRMRINRIHITDPSKLIIKNQNDYFSGLFSRISNTGGQIKIEGVPGKSRTGWFWKMAKALFDIEDTLEDNAEGTRDWTDDSLDYEIPQEITKIFTAIKVTIDDAVRYNVIPPHVQQFLKNTLPPAEYRRTCMGEFPLPEGAAFGGPFQMGEHAAGFENL